MESGPESGEGRGQREVNQYVLFERIGTGGMSTVRRARLKGSEEDVAVKVIPFDELNREFEGRLRREPEIHRQLQHDNIVELKDWFREGEEFFLVMEYVPGQSLSELIRKRGPLSFVEARDIMRGVLRAVAHLHSLDVIHRDIKPGNILLRPDGEAVLTDFGIAKFGWQQGETKTQAGLGTPEYMSPEQVRGNSIDYRTDIWSLGITLFEMLTGKKPFARGGETPAEYAGVISRILGGELPDPRVYHASVPDGAIRVIRTATGRTPDERFGSVAEMLGALEVVDPRIITPLPDDDATVVLGADVPRDNVVATAEGEPPRPAASASSPEPVASQLMREKKSGRFGLTLTLFILFVAVAGYVVWQLYEGWDASPSGGLSEAEALGIARGIANEFEGYSFNGNVAGLASLYGKSGVDFYRLQNVGQREIADDYRTFFGRIVSTEQLDVTVMNATPLSDSSLLTRWSVAYKREKGDGTILRGVATVDVTIAWVEERWRIISERMVEIRRDDIAALPPPDLSDLDEEERLDSDLPELPDDLPDEVVEIDAGPPTSSEMRGAVTSIVGLLSQGEGDLAWSRYASDDLKSRSSGFPAILSEGGLRLGGVTIDGESAIATVLQGGENSTEEFRLRLTFEKKPDLKVTSVTPVQ